MSHVVALPVYDGMTLLEYGAVIEALGFRWSELPELDYELHTCGPKTGVTTLSGAALVPQFPIEAIADADTVIVTGVSDVDRDRCAEWGDLLRTAAARGARMVSVCTGAFALAEAGLLDGRRATTHWRHEHLMRSEFPAVELDIAAIVVRDGNFLTSAGASAGLDLSIALIRDDHGPERANDIARRLVVTPHRHADQSQFVDVDRISVRDDPTFTRMLAAVGDDVGRRWTIRDLAHEANLSPRTLHRRFRAYTGFSPLDWIVRQRIRAAMSLLERTDRPIEAIGRATGFDAAETFRYHFRRVCGTSPRDYRTSFRGA
ncbi:helix-turn-helix domain-containing protein [Rhodococcus sp. HNM0563]|uniref:GlxA family transcriptional regulator n=1 Tax=unclassified Rhodococcus (in: high G+C Gram-positive bacteria) TaxID=192944 RepID=UPI00146A8348|nr:MULTISPECIES: helix-turn-helix domain-containing protein [unclassified Rhodococcus (in: high G+C Gram-positive bacteria)]MCK0093184.1 helix-turn-helix domain-containing protein [Rhodococcus sp. F64268]NLU65164.1 helix-turn-helix domain-containing protein [Rhodococcus sp. HNM0563]